ncbi:MAG: alpha/beta fold hydrolase [Acidimicrobiia bacterium]
MSLTDPEITEPPSWFRANIAAPCDSAFVDVLGAPVHYLRWGDRAKPGLIFVHGGAANAEWFRHIAPFFTDDFNVAALDMAGMGESGTHESYSPSVFAAGVLGVLEDAGMFAHPVPPIVVGHSMGGMVSSEVARRHGERLRGVVFCDVGRPRFDADRPRVSMPPTVKKYYPSREAALERYRLAPAQPCLNRYILDHLREVSVREDPQGWTFKFDVNVFSMDRMSPEVMERSYKGIPCATAFLFGARSHLVSAESIELLRLDTEGRAPMVVVPEANHHLFIDQPLAFIAALRAVFAGWLVARD